MSQCIPQCFLNFSCSIQRIFLVARRFSVCICFIYLWGAFGYIESLSIFSFWNLIITAISLLFMALASSRWLQLKGIRIAIICMSTAAFVGQLYCIYNDLHIANQPDYPAIVLRFLVIFSICLMNIETLCFSAQRRNIFQC